MTTDTLIIGGGLAGLALARRLQASGLSWQLIEAQDRLGGRIMTHTVTHDGHTGHYDMGPAWFWPGQARMAALVQQLGLSVFEQYASGALSYEDASGHVQRGRGYASMEGSYRLRGGLSALIDALKLSLPKEQIHLQNKALQITQDGDTLRTRLSSPTGEHVLSSRTIVLALPPRIAAAHIDFGDLLSKNALQTMHAIPTWMAGHAKVVAIYERPFWRQAGLSGDAMSRRGPLAEIHDASPAKDGPYALFGFVGEPVSARKDTQALIERAKVQLVRLFGQEAATTLQIVVQDWAYCEETATELDHQPLNHHPSYGLPQVLTGLAGGRLMFGGTETGHRFGGYLEGALEAAQRCANELTSQHLQGDHR